MNDYEQLGTLYEKSNTKPDKHYSILPTVLQLVGTVQGKDVLDLGCGNGFFSEALAHAGADSVLGIDSSATMLAAAKAHPPNACAYKHGDIFSPSSFNSIGVFDVVNAPFVLNYAQDTSMLLQLFGRVHKALKSNGVFVGVIDLPTGQDLSRFGARKTLHGPAIDGASMEIALYKSGDFICALRAVYFTQNTIRDCLHSVGFWDVEWHEPIISQAGINAMGAVFWEGYRENPELRYFTARKGA